MERRHRGPGGAHRARPERGMGLSVRRGDERPRPRRRARSSGASSRRGAARDLREWQRGRARRTRGRPARAGDPRPDGSESVPSDRGSRREDRPNPRPGRGAGRLRKGPKRANPGHRVETRAVPSRWRLRCRCCVGSVGGWGPGRGVGPNEEGRDQRGPQPAFPNLTTSDHSNRRRVDTRDPEHQEIRGRAESGSIGGRPNPSRVSAQRKPWRGVFIPRVAAHSPSTKSLPRGETLPEPEAIGTERHCQWPVFHLIEQPIGGTKVEGGWLPAKIASRTSRMTCFFTLFEAFESPSFPRYRSLRVESNTKKSGVHTAPYASATFWLSSRR